MATVRLPQGLGSLTGAVLGAGGMAIVAILGLRALASGESSVIVTTADIESEALGEQLLQLAVDLARRAGDAAADGRRTMDEIVGAVGKRSRAPPTSSTLHDRAAEAIIAGGLRAARPDDGIVGEEGTTEPAPRASAGSSIRSTAPRTSSTAWPAMAVSIAAADGAAPSPARSTCPRTDELFAADAAPARTCNGDRSARRARPVAVGGARRHRVRVRRPSVACPGRRRGVDHRRGPRHPPLRLRRGRPVLRRRRPRSTPTSRSAWRRGISRRAS